MKEELGRDHFEGRSWHGLHHHAVLTMVAFAFLQHIRVREKKLRRSEPTTRISLPAIRRMIVAKLAAPSPCPHCRGLVRALVPI